MTNQNQAEKDAKALTTPKDDAPQKAAKPSEVERELTDDEIAAVAGGHASQPSTQKV
jgi:hypothetical protein